MSFSLHHSRPHTPNTSLKRSDSAISMDIYNISSEDFQQNIAPVFSQYRQLTQLFESELVKFNSNTSRSGNNYWCWSRSCWKLYS